MCSLNRNMLDASCVCVLASYLLFKFASSCMRVKREKDSCLRFTYNVVDLVTSSNVHLEISYYCLLLLQSSVLSMSLI